MTEHLPKTAALLAYADDLLSIDGRRRVDAHLASCAVCRRELAAIEGYAQFAREAREAAPPALDFDRMERALAAEAERVSATIVRKRRAPVWIASGLALAAAAGLVVYVAWPNEAAPIARPEPRDERTDPVAPPVRIALHPTVTVTAGGASVVEPDGSLRPLALGDVIAEGERVRTGDTGLVHVRISDGTGFVLASRSELAVDRAQDDEVRLTLAQGRVSSVVADDIVNSSRYVVLCAGHTLEVHGTRFVVSYVDTTLRVGLEEGALGIRTPDGELIELVAPAQWTNAQPLPEGQLPFSTPHDLRPSDSTAVTLADPLFVRWSIGELALDATGPVALNLPLGEHRVQAWDLRGRLHTALLQVGRDPVLLEAGELVAEEPRLRPGHLAQEEINRVLDRGLRQMQQCYERTLRRYPEVNGRLRLRLDVGLMGEVRRAQAIGSDGEAGEALRRCVEGYAARWTFSPPGGPVSLELPISFSGQ